ncbi:SPTB2 protein, partial [Nothoprocta pentlandii]|nr:SPTB2 protein [Nothoprocta pentlandii]
MQRLKLQPQVVEETAISPPLSPISDALLGPEPSSMVPHSPLPEDSLLWDPSETSTVLLPPRGAGSLGGTVNLILSIGKKGEKKLALGGERPGEEAPQTERYGQRAGKSSAALQAVKPAPAAGPPAPRAAATHTLPKAGPGSIFNSLQRKEKEKAEHARLLTLQGIMGPSSLQPLPEERRGPSNTWPLKCGRRKAPPAAPGPQLGELLLYVKNPLVRDIDAECGAAPGVPRGSLPHHGVEPSAVQPADGPRSTCPHLALGSVLSVELPKDLAVLGCLRGTAAAAQHEEAEGKEKRQGRGVKRWEEEDAGGPGAQGPGEGLGKPPKGERGTWFEEVSFNPSYSRRKVRGLEAARCSSEERSSPDSTSEDLLDFSLNRLSRISVLHEQVGREWDELAARLGHDGSASTAAVESAPSCQARLREATRVELRPSPTAPMARAGAATGLVPLGWPPGGRKPSKEVLAGLSDGGPNSPPAAPQGSRAAPQLSVFACELGGQQHSPESLGTAEICHPAHKLFEEEEEELQAIWEHAEEQMPPSSTQRLPASRTGSLQSPDVNSGPLILSATNNVLVAKFTLPTAAQLLHSPVGEKGPSDRQRGSGSPSTRGAALPCPEAPHGMGQSMSTAWTDSPSSRDQHQDEEREGSKAPPNKMEFQMMEGTLERKHVLQTGGRRATCRAWSLFHAVLMRQTLCFYQDRRDSLKSSVVALPLNLSGAVCTPDTEYTKKTNCFRLHLRDGSEYLLRAPSQLLMNEWVSKLQQNSGFPEVDYFQAAAQSVESPGSAAGFSKVPGPGSSHLQSHSQAVTAKSPEIVVLPRTNARLQLPFGSQDGPADVAASSAEAHGAASHTAGHREHQWLPSGSPGSWDNSCPEDDYGLVANKRRSYSFTSATYQKITPVAVPKEPVEAGSSYSVTLYIGEQAPAVPRTRCHSFVARPGSPREVLGEKTQAPPRPKNKSVFKKFFGKKE